MCFCQALRRLEVALREQGADDQDVGLVVEAAGLFVRWERVGWLGRVAEQLVDGVVVFDPGQAPERAGPGVEGFSAAGEIAVFVAALIGRGVCFASEDADCSQCNWN